MNKLPKGWVWTELNQVSEIILGQSPDSKDVNNSGNGLPFYQGKTEFGSIHPTPRYYCTKPKKIAEKNDILLSVRAPVGPTNIANEKMVIGRGLSAIRETQITNYKFIYYFFKNIENWLSSQGTGTTFQAITGQFVKDLKFPLPPKAEQDHIAELLDNHLSQVARISQKLNGILPIIKNFRQSVLAQAVSGELLEGLDLGSWENVKLSEITTKIGSGSTPKGGNSVYKSEGIPFIRSMNIYSDFIKFDDLAYIDAEQAEKLKNVEIKENDILLNITGASIGRVNITPIEFIGGRVNQHVAIIRCKDNLVNPKYLHLYIASPNIQKWVAGENYGATRQALTKTQLEQLEIKLPPLAEQRQIVETVERLFALADNLETQVKQALERVEHLTQSILHQAFIGNLSRDWREQHPELITGEHSAEVLLAQIAAAKPAKKPKGKKTIAE